MSRRSIVTLVCVAGVGAALWLGGQALWQALLVMHGHGG